MGRNLKLESYSDREILHVMWDLGQDDFLDPEIIAVRLGLARNGLSEEQFSIHAKRCIGTRLAWIKKLTGTVERENGKSRWRLTPDGVKVVQVKIAPGFATQLEELAGFSAVAALESLSRRYMSADVKAANLMRRQWMYGTHPNRRG